MDRNISYFEDVTILDHEESCSRKDFHFKENICISSLVSIEGTVKKRFNLYGLVNFEISGIMIRLYVKIIATHNSFSTLP